MFNNALLALEASDGIVVVTSLVLVFGMLVALCLIIMLEGKIFESLDAKNKPAPKDKPKAPRAPAPKAPAPAPKAPAPKADGIPGEIVAAIAAAVASLDGSWTIKGIRRAKRSAGGSRRGVWGDAGVSQNTNPFGN